jgi:hypothetical protein
MPKALCASNGLSLSVTRRAHLAPLAQHPILGLQVLNNEMLLTADPTGKQKDDEGEWRRLRVTPTKSSLAHPILREYQLRAPTDTGHYALCQRRIQTLSKQ